MYLHDGIDRPKKGVMVHMKGDQALGVKGGNGHLRVCCEMIESKLSFCSKEDEIHRS